MALTITVRATATVPLEWEGLTPDGLHDRSAADIARLPIFHGNQKVELGDFFEVGGSATDGVWRLVGNFAGVHWIGAGMQGGEIRVEGAAGRHLGSGMRGGAITVAGDAGDWVGGEMRGGVIRIEGRAGHLVGAAYRGSAKGMLGGTILVHGDAGNEIGHTMRRGTIAVGGKIGDLVGFNLLAGTILAFGESGIRPGAGMKRGTIGLFGNPAMELLPTFRFACRFRPLVLRLLLNRLAELGMPIPEDRSFVDCELYHGDLLNGGRGEILLPVG